MARKASSQYAIELQAVKGINRNLVTLASAYVPASRAKEHLQTYTDSIETWQKMLDKSLKQQVHTAHDALAPTRAKGQACRGTHGQCLADARHRPGPPCFEKSRAR